MAGEEEEDDETSVEPNVGAGRSQRHPFDRAKAALKAAREARGGGEEEEEEPVVTHDPRDPLARAQAALDAARDARESGGRIQREREARARAELDQLKALSGEPPMVRPGDKPTDGDDDPAPSPPVPRKREL